MSAVALVWTRFRLCAHIAGVPYSHTQRSRVEEWGRHPLRSADTRHLALVLTFTLTVTPPPPPRPGA